jgi:hypothetical protein
MIGGSFGVRRAVVAGVAAACLVSAVPASAHLRSGTVAVDYRASIAVPVTAAYAAQIYQSDHGLSLTRRPGHVVVMLGYLGEPVMRLDAAGMWVNAASPTALAIHLVAKGRGVESAAPRWRLERGRRTVVWHDARVQGLPAGVDAGRWSVPLVIDGRRDELRGELRRFPAPPLWLWLTLLAMWLAAGALAMLPSRRTGARDAAMTFGMIAAGAAGVTVVALALDAYASPGTWIEGLDVLVFLAVGVAVMWRGARGLHVAAAIWLGLVSAAVGLLEGAVFLHPIVLSVLPGTVMRVLVVTALGAGASAAMVGSTQFGEITEAVREHERRLARAPAAPGAVSRRHPG